ncbi:NusA-like transcription termination signal-binding factor [Candidatus Woesearchaeota archaeon]|nr:NusA-like transcription termination signal-binding factor [Candidatus Woesearchaeota archaeon]
MTKTTFTNETIRLIGLFERVTHAKLKDCFFDDNKLLVFVVYPNNILKAVGPKAKNVKTLENKLNRKIKIIEYNEDITRFIKNLVFPNKLKTIRLEDDKLVLEADNIKARGVLIGRGASNLRNLESITKKYFKEVNEIKII